MFILFAFFQFLLFFVAELHQISYCSGSKHIWVILESYCLQLVQALQARALFSS